jgi:hypothetical protein
MANIDFPRGLQPWKKLEQANYYTVASDYGTAVYIGDPVIASGTNRNVTLATAGTGNKVLGAVIGVYDTNMLPLSYLPASTGGYVLVADHPDQVFVAQGDGAVSYLDINDCNGNINLVSGTGSSVNYRSGWELDDSDTGGNTAGDQIRLIKPVQSADNTVGIANCLWECKINNHQALQGIVGAGV